MAVTVESSFDHKKLQRCTHFEGGPGHWQMLIKFSVTDIQLNQIKWIVEMQALVQAT